jgi:hypothetical protein
MSTTLLTPWNNTLQICTASKNAKTILFIEAYKINKYIIDLIA